MMDHKVLLFLLDPGQVPAEIRGLIANKLMAKYQRPCCMLTETKDEDGKFSYQGSARGCDKVGITEFKSICAATQVCDYTIGHEGAFGLGLPADKINAFVESTDKQLANMASEPIYYVDYIWAPDTADSQAILDIAEFEPYIGKDMDEPLVAIYGIHVTKDNLTMMASNTVKITLPNGVTLIKFRMPDEEYNQLYSEYGYVEIDVVGTGNCNEWAGHKYAQILIKDYEITGRCAYVF
jgi:single-stranded DNA-specific DHH superfamily exonuclease